MANPWVITAAERATHDAQFRQLGPAGGMITGEQARGLFMQSGLPPPMLGQIWGLADLNKDGKMDPKEFSIAMHLIQNQMKGIPTPPVLPDSLRMDPLPPMPMGGAMPPMGMGGGVPPMGMGMPPMGGAPPPRPPSAGGGGFDYSMPQGTKLKYAQMFNNLDKTRVGVLSGVHARNILSQSGLPMPILAQIWGLSDLDKDGRLSSDEFCLAMHFVDLVKSGIALPPSVPQSLIPPAARARTLSQGEGYGIPVPQAPGGVPMDPDGAPQAASLMAASFEDRRKQNFDKGQAELEKRRAVIQEGERREREERERKERDAHEKRERERMEMERRRQLDMEKQMARQREVEMQRQEEQQRMQEQREAARRELEKQRHAEAERQRLNELMRLRQSEQEHLCSAKQKHKNLTFQLQALGEKSGEMNQQITEMREKIVAITSQIEGMKSSRDSKLAEMESMKADINSKQHRLTSVGQEKYDVMSKKRVQAGSTDPVKESLRQVNQSFANKKLNMERLNSALAEVEAELGQKKSVTEERKAYLARAQTQLADLTNHNRDIYNQVIAKQKEARAALDAYRGGSAAPPEAGVGAGDSDPWGGGGGGGAGGFGDSFTADFGNSGGDAGGFADSANWPEQATMNTPAPAANSGNTTRYRALYEFVSRSADELSFQPGDVILVFQEHGPMEPGWLAGQIKDKVGWFPESFAELIQEGDEGNGGDVWGGGGAAAPPAKLPSIDEEGTTAAVPTSTSVGSVKSAAGSVTADDEIAQALYAWKAKKDTHITFAKGDQIKIVEKQEMWWKGELVSDPSVKGFFPKSYVKLISGGTGAGGGRRQSGSRSQTPGSEAEPPKTPDEEHKEAVAAAEGDGGEGAWFVALYSFAAPESGDLGFEAGERIWVTKQDGDWWSGVVGDRSGIFPCSYVQTDGAEAVAEVVEEAPVAAAPVAAAVEVGKVIAPFAGGSPNQLTLSPGDLIRIRTKSPTGWWEGELQKKGQEKVIGWFPGNYVKLMQAAGSAPGSETASIASAAPLAEGEAEAQFDYAAQQPDELSFSRGAKMKIVEKVDAEWWKGQLEDGSEGIFPAAYVREGVIGGGSGGKCAAAKLELAQTEANYIADLKMVVSVFRKPLRKAKVLSSDEAKILFGNWEDIITIAKAFSDDLKGKESQIGELFMSHMSAFGAYATFCKLQQRSLDLLGRKESTDPEFRAVYSQCCQSNSARGLPLSHFLLLPMTRITKYPLVVQKIHKYSQDGSEKAALQMAEEALKVLLRTVNKEVTEVENLQMLHWCQEHIRTPTISPTLVFQSNTNRLGPRSLLHAGLLRKAKSNRLLLGLLFNDMLLLATPEEALEKEEEWKLSRNVDAVFSLYKLPLLLHMATPLLPRENTGSEENAKLLSLEVSGEEGPIVLNVKAVSGNARTLWVNKLNGAIRAAREAHPERHSVVGSLVTGLGSIFMSPPHTPPGIGRSVTPKASVGRLLVELVCIRHFPPQNYGNEVEVRLSLGTQKENRVIDLATTKDSVLTTQLMMEAPSGSFRLGVWVPRRYSPHLCAGVVDIATGELVRKSASHRGPILQQHTLRDSELPTPSPPLDVILKFVVHMIDNFM